MVLFVIFETVKSLSEMFVRLVLTQIIFDIGRQIAGRLVATFFY